MSLKYPRRLNIQYMCQVAQVSRSGYYAYCKRIQITCLKDIQDEIDFAYIKEAFNYRGVDKGARQIKMRLMRKHKMCMNLKKISRLMKKFGLVCTIRQRNPYRQMMREMATNEISENKLNRHFKQGVARKILLTDITYITYGVTKRAYLSVIKDASTNKILSYMTSESLDVEFVLKTVQGLVESQMGDLNLKVILHSDQGAHYTSHAFKTILNQLGIESSMSRRGNCLDNSAQESFFGHMKDEIHFVQYKTYIECANAIINYINYYNYDRPQWGLNRLTPHEYESYLDRDNQFPLTLPTLYIQPIIYL